jgi:regulator of protease activity HflC (stomatin/prohibitin superfamily)
VRWLASRPRGILAGAFILMLLGVLLVRSLRVSSLGGTGVVLVFLLFFATLMAHVAPRRTPRPPSPR